jgi:hypothetical protein
MDPTLVLPQFLIEVKEDLTLELKPTRILDWGGERTKEYEDLYYHDLMTEHSNRRINLGKRV